MQRSNGVFSSMTIRQPKEHDPNGYCYDYDLAEHSIVLSDWMHREAEAYQPSVPGVTPRTDSVLINGRGQAKGYYGISEVFCVKCGGKYVFRMVNAGSLNCPIEVTVCIWKKIMHFNQVVLFRE